MSDPTHRRHRWERRTGAILLHSARGAFLLCLAATPLLYGGRHPLATGAAGLCVLATLALWTAGFAFKGQTRLIPTWGWAPFAMAAAVGLMQLSPELFGMLAPEALRSLWNSAALSGTCPGQPVFALDPGFQTRTLIVLLLLILLQLAGSQLFATPGTLLALAAGIVLAASVSGLLGMAQHFGGDQWFLWMHKASRDALSAGYPNKDHFAQLQYIGMFTGMGAAAALYGAPRGSTLHGLCPPILHRTLAPAMLASVVICALGLALSACRTGILLSIAGTAAFWSVMLLGRRRGRTIPLSLLAAAAAVLWAGLHGMDMLLERLELALSGEDPSGLVRLELWQLALRCILASPWLGAGFAGMRTLSPTLDTGLAPGRIAFNAHNDYLDLAVMLGIPCAVLILAVGGWFLWRAVRGAAATRGSSLFPMLLGTLVAIFVTLLHESADFGLKQPANLAIFTAACLLAGGLASQARHADGDGQNPAHHRRHAGRAAYALPVLYALAAAPLACHCIHLARTGHAMAMLETAEAAKGIPAESRLGLMESSARRLLGLDPANENGLYAMAHVHRSRAAALQTAQMAESLTRLLGREVPPGRAWNATYAGDRDAAFERIPAMEREKAAQEYGHAASWYRAIAALSPSNAIATSALAEAFDLAAGWRGGTESALTLHMYAAKQYPAHADILAHAAEGIWRAWRLEANPAGREALRRDAAVLAGRLAGQRPATLSDTLPRLWAMGTSPSEAIALAPASIQGQEQLAAFLAGKGLHAQALQALQAMERLNGARPDKETPETLGRLGFLRREPRSKAAVARMATEASIPILEAMGDHDGAGRARIRLIGQRKAERQPVIERIDALMRNGEHLLAEEVIRSVPDDPRALVRLAEILHMAGREEKLRLVLGQIGARTDELDASDLERLEKLAPMAGR